MQIGLCGILAVLESKKRMTWAAALGAILLALLSLQHAQAETPYGPVVARFRVLHQNIYGRDKKGCAERYRALARHILEANPPYDIVSLNEHWNTTLGDLVGETCDADILTDALLSDGRYRDSHGVTRNHRSYPKGGVFQFNGGNSIFTLHPITGFFSAMFENSNSVPVAGYMRTQISIAPGVTVDFWSAHFEAGSDNCQEKCHRTEVRQLARSLVIHRSANPVIIAGDLNLGGPVSIREREDHERDPQGRPYDGNPGYDFLMDELRNPRDLWLEAHPEQRFAEDGYTYDARTNRLAYDADHERIDYLLNPDNPAFQNAVPSLRVARMELVRWQTSLGAEISDHYGLDATLEILAPKLVFPNADAGGAPYVSRADRALSAGS